jgi:hypothetical protein
MQSAKIPPIQLAGRDMEESTSIIGAQWGRSQGSQSVRRILDQPKVSMEGNLLLAHQEGVSGAEMGSLASVSQ